MPIQWGISRYHTGLVLRGTVEGGVAMTIINMPPEAADYLLGLAAALERQAALRRALEWYANPGNYAVTSAAGSQVDNDNGERALAALRGETG